MGAAMVRTAAPLNRRVPQAPVVHNGHQIAIFGGHQSSLNPSVKSSAFVMPVAFLDTLPTSIAKRPLTESDAIDIWVARWMRVRRKDLVARYNCDPRRLYEIWEETRFPGSRDKALSVVRERFPSLLDCVDTGPHRRLPLRSPHPDQLNLFD